MNLLSLYKARAVRTGYGGHIEETLGIYPSFYDRIADREPYQPTMGERVL